MLTYIRDHKTTEKRPTDVNESRLENKKNKIRIHVCIDRRKIVFQKLIFHWSISKVMVKDTFFPWDIHERAILPINTTAIILILIEELIEETNLNGMIRDRPK